MILVATVTRTSNSCDTTGSYDNLAHLMGVVIRHQKVSSRRGKRDLTQTREASVSADTVLRTEGSFLTSPSDGRLSRNRNSTNDVVLKLSGVKVSLIRGQGNRLQTIKFHLGTSTISVTLLVTSNQSGHSIGHYIHIDHLHSISSPVSNIGDLGVGCDGNTHRGFNLGVCSNSGQLEGRQVQRLNLATSLIRNQHEFLIGSNLNTRDSLDLLHRRGTISISISILSNLSDSQTRFRNDTTHFVVAEIGDICKAFIQVIIEVSMDTIGGLELRIGRTTISVPLGGSSKQAYGPVSGSSRRRRRIIFVQYLKFAISSNSGFKQLIKNRSIVRLVLIVHRGEEGLVILIAKTGFLKGGIAIASNLEGMKRLGRQTGQYNANRKQRIHRAS
mmetsp:Transcript_941/g.2036  ORF Transcript_941/g.2036 Transcript_941/m.2036 type:complete len:387 (-) Transcript_941:98-1258(-)